MAVLKPICVPCERFMRPKKNGYSFMEGMPLENKAPPGKEAPEKWKPYKLWIGDLWECPTCGTQVITETGNTPVSEHYMEHFTHLCEGLNATLLVKDC